MVDVSSQTENLGPLDSFMDRQLPTNALYNAQGRKIGWFDNYAALAQKRATVYAGENPVDFMSVKIKTGIFKAPENATEWLARNGYVPSWLPVEQRQALATKDAATPESIDEITASGMRQRDIKIMAIAGFGVLATIMLLRR